MDRPPIIDYNRLKRLNQQPDKGSVTSTQICLVIIFMTGLYLFKRFKDKQRSRTQRILEN
jgi:hypothetical protein